MLGLISSSIPWTIVYLRLAELCQLVGIFSIQAQRLSAGTTQSVTGISVDYVQAVLGIRDVRRLQSSGVVAGQLQAGYRQDMAEFKRPRRSISLSVKGEFLCLLHSRSRDGAFRSNRGGRRFEKESKGPSREMDLIRTVIRRQPSGA